MTRIVAAAEVVGAVLALVLSVPFAMWLFARRRPYVVVPALGLAWWLLPAQLAPVYLALLALGAGTQLVWGLARAGRRQRAAVVVANPSPRVSAGASPGVLPLYVGGATVRHQSPVPVHRVATEYEQLTNYASAHQSALGPALGVSND